MAKSDKLQGYRSDHTWRSFARGDRPEDLVFGVVISVLLHCILFLGSDYWLRAFAPKQELSEPIPIEYVEVPPNTTKTPPQTSRRAAKDSVAGGKAKPQSPISTAQSGSSTARTSAASKPSDILLPEQTQQKAGSPNRSPQKLQPEPQKIAVAPTTKQPEPLQSAIGQSPVPAAIAPTPKLPEPQPEPTAVAPTTKPLAFKLRQRTATPTTPAEPLQTPVAPAPKPPEPEPSPTAVAPTTKPLALKLRQRVATPTTPAEPLQTPVAPTPKPPEPQPEPTAVVPTSKPLALKPRQTTVAPTTKSPEPVQTPVAPTPKPPEPQPLPTAVAPTTKPLALKPQQTTLPPTTKPPALKRRQTTVAPTTKPPAALIRQGNRDRLAAKSSPQQLENRTTSQSSQGARGLSPRKVSRVQPSSKSGGASRLGGPISLSSRDFASSNQAALPNSNRLNQSVDGIDARQDADMGAYLQQLQEQVRQHWIPGLTQSSRRTVLHFTVSRAGLVSNIRIAQTSGLSMTDEAAVNAVKQAVPFAPLPTAYTQNYINIQFTFNINIYGELELGRDGQ
ncbi:TonB family protein [Scytonema sp. HK-05]|nr:TonB family protein [Scytonema sp. HK-05]